MKASEPPATHAVSGAELLDATVRILRRFLWFQHDEDYDAVALWIAHTWVYDAFTHSPRLSFTSMEYGAGKSTAMYVSGLMCRDLYKVSKISPAALRIKIATQHPTIALDEADIMFGSTTNRNAEIRTILNDGYEVTGMNAIAVSNGSAVKDWMVFGPAMFAGVGRLPASLQDRAFAVMMKEPPRALRPQRFRIRVHDMQVRQAGEALGQWARSMYPELSDIIPDPVDGLDMRAEAIAEPLLVIGLLAGGDWKDRSVAAVRFAFTRASDPETIPEPMDVRLLRDIRDLLTGERTATSVLVRSLLEREPWKTIWSPVTAPVQLAGLLSGFGIAPRPMRIHGELKRGYERADFTAAWESLSEGKVTA